MNAKEILNGVEAFRGFPDGERLRAADSARLARLPAGGKFYHQGQRVDEFALVAAGSLRVYRIGESGREITLYHVRAGEPCLVNILSVMLRKEACATAQAEVPLTALLLPGSLVREWIGSSETFRNYVFNTMGRRLIDVMTLVEEIAFRKMDQRLIKYLKRQFVSSVRIEVTHEAIAAELGTAREVISRLLESFAREGVIELGRGWIRVKNIARSAPRSRLVT